MQLNIRDTTKDDLSAILDIYNDEILNGTATFHTIPQTIAERVQWLANTQGKQYPCMVAEVMDEMTGGNRIVAYCNLWHYKERPAYDGWGAHQAYSRMKFSPTTQDRGAIAVCAQGFSRSRYRREIARPDARRGEKTRGSVPYYYR